MRVILASASPRRRELLEQIGIPFEVCVSHVEERITETRPEKVVEQLSAQKAEAVLQTLSIEARETLLVIGADTIVAADDRILGKPADTEEAEKMLQLLSGRTHEVYTGVTLLLCREEGTVWRKLFHEKTTVRFFAMTEEEIRGYVATGDCLDKAGAYGIQGFCARYIEGIDGDYNNVVGLPVGRLYQEAKDWLQQSEAAER